MADRETVEKLRRLGHFLDRNQLDGVLLQQRANFAWITGGRDNAIANNSESGVASILATHDSRICFASSIDAPRLRDEELKDTGIQVVNYPWSDRVAAHRLLSDLIDGRAIAGDACDDTNPFGPALLDLPSDFVELRWALTAAEVERYREGARRASVGIETACRQLEHGMTENEIAGILDAGIRAHGCTPVLTRVAADERVDKYRRPLPTEMPVDRFVMLVTGAMYRGLISCATRFVSFVPPDANLKRKQEAVLAVEAALVLSTRPARTLGELFEVARQAYADNGFPDQIAMHHQGGSTGYQIREMIAEPGSNIIVVNPQAFAWNPSVNGIKSEDTILCTADGVEFLTGVSDTWPQVTAYFGDATLQRPDILVR